MFGTASWRVVNEGSLGRLIGVASAMKGWFVWPHGVGGNEGMIVWPRGIDRMPSEVGCLASWHRQDADEEGLVDWPRCRWRQ